MMFTAHLKLTIWHPRRESGRGGPERIRRERAAVGLFQAITPIHKFIKGQRTPKVQGKLWNIIDEALKPTGRTR